jgi:hypothetical protein
MADSLPFHSACMPFEKRGKVESSEDSFSIQAPHATILNHSTLTQIPAQHFLQCSNRSVPCPLSSLCSLSLTCSVAEGSTGIQITANYHSVNISTMSNVKLQSTCKVPELSTISSQDLIQANTPLTDTLSPLYHTDRTMKPTSHWLSLLPPP